MSVVAGSMAEALRFLLLAILNDWSFHLLAIAGFDIKDQGQEESSEVEAIYRYSVAASNAVALVLTLV